MQNFLGNPCPYCGKNFEKDDDIVVCPECGTPHHRECYKEHSACANEEKHSETYEWKSVIIPAPTKNPVPAPEKAAASSGEPAVCRTCGRENPSDAHFCLGCGARLVPAERHIPTAEDFRKERARIYTEAFGDNLNGVSPKEAAIYVRTNIEYFLPRFAAFTKGAKFDTNFSAFIFSYLYLFYRKMYALGAAVFGATMLLSIPTFLLDLVTIQEQYVEMGLLSQIIWEIPHQKELAVYSIIANLLIWIIRIALMMFFNRLYFTKMVNTIKEARPKLAAKSENAISSFFKKKGGTSMVLPIILCCLVFLSSFVLAGFIVSSEFFILPDVSNLI